MSKHFKIVLTVRFLGYLLFFVGTLAFVSMLGPLIQVESSYRMDKLLGVKRTVPTVITSNDKLSNTGPDSFGGVTVSGSVIAPVSTNFGIVIEKINANAKVIADVNPASERDYSQALTQGVAHAAGTKYPGEKGNIYLFSHSTDAPWNIVRFNAVFYLLRELESGDRIVTFYKDKRYDYIVFDKIVVDPSDVSYLTNSYDASILTLQTCDPPGTLFKRLIVRAKLAGS